MFIPKYKIHATNQTTIQVKIKQNLNKMMLKFVNLIKISKYQQIQPTKIFGTPLRTKAQVL